MDKSFFNDKGGKFYAKDFAQHVLQEDGLSVSMGMGLVRKVFCNGHVYKGAHIDSCCQLRGGWAIRLSKGQRLSWHTRSLPFIPEYFRPVSDVRPDAPKGAVLIFEYAMGNGAAYPQPNGYFELSINGRPEIVFSLKKNSHLYENEKGIRLYMEVRRKKIASFGDSFSLDEFVKGESIYVNGLAYLYIPHKELKGRKGFRLTVRAHNADKTSLRWFRIGYCYQQLDCDIADGINQVLSEKTPRQIDGKKVYFGDIHVHTGQTRSLKGNGCGRLSVRQNLTYARDVSGLDFCAITDHDWQLDAYDWNEVRKENERFNHPGRFVTLHAYEWTSGNYGHRNVYFRNDSLPEDLAPFDYQPVPHALKKFGRATPNDPTPNDLWNWLDGLDVKAMTIPHHPNAEQFPMDFFRFFEPRYDRCVEIYSNWGCFLKSAKELNLCCDRIDSLSYERYAGKLHFGFLASSDGHDSNAGEANLTKKMKQMAHYLGSGRVAVYAEELTRQSVFDAIYDRHCYAVTGTPILLTFSINEAEMGDVITETCDKLAVKLHAVGTNPVRTASIYRNYELIKRVDSIGELDFTLTFEASPEQGSYYAEVMQEDCEYAWSSPILYAPEKP